MEYRAIHELLCAAMINHTFCEILLADAFLAVTGGYDGHAFDLTPEEHDLVTHIRAISLEDFAEQVGDWMEDRQRRHWHTVAAAEILPAYLNHRMGKPADSKAEVFVPAESARFIEAIPVSQSQSADMLVQ